MSLLSTFGILFETDAEKAKREVDDVDKALNDAKHSAEDTAEAFEELDSATNESADSLSGLSDNLGGVAAGLVTVLGLFAGITAQAIGNDEIGKFSTSLGLNVEELGAWSEAATRAGGDAASFRGSLSSLTGSLTEITLNGGGDAAETFARLGIGAFDASGKIKDAFKILPELAKSFEGLSKQESARFGEKLGLDQGTILLLQQGRTSVEELVKRQKELGVITEADALAAAKFNDTWADTKQVFSNLLTSSGTTILPLLNIVLEGLTSVGGWIKQNKTLVTGFFIGAGLAITAVYLPAAISAAAATLAILAPFLLVGAAVAAVGVAFAVLYEDISAFSKGQSSFIGDMVEKYEILGVAIDALGVVADHLAANFKTITDWIMMLFTSPLEAIDSLVDGVKNAVDEIVNLIPNIGESFNDSIAGIKSFFGIGNDEIDASITKAIDVTGAIDNNPLNGQTSASIVNSRQSVTRTSNVNVGGVNVNTAATDSQGVADAVNGSLKDQVSLAVGNFEDAEAY